MVSPTSSMTLLSVSITSSPVYFKSSEDLNMFTHSPKQTTKMPGSSSIQATGPLLYKPQKFQDSLLYKLQGSLL